MKFKTIILLICLGMGIIYASATDYQTIYQEEQKEFNMQMGSEIKKTVISSSKKVQELYRAIDYQPVWVDKDYLTQYAELLIHEIREDFKRGLHPELVDLYKELLPDNRHIFTSNSLEDRVKIELGIMQLYVEHINDILKEKKSKYTALSLLQHALKEKSLIHALNSISKERIKYRTPILDKNSTIIKESEKIDIDSITILRSSDEKERLKAMYNLLQFQPVWISKAGFSSYTKSLFNQIENDITFNKDSKTYKNYQTLKTIVIPKEKQNIVTYEFKIAKLYQDYMSHLLYGDIDWKTFQSKLKHKKNADWVVHNILSTPESLLIEAISHQSLDYAFKEATPVFPLYGRLVTALKKYQNIVDSGGWETLGEFKSLKPGMSNSVVPKIRERLTKEGDYIPCAENNNSELYDECLLQAVKRFQTRHGLTSEGFIGKMTQKALNESAENKVARIKLNLDRMKWIKRGHDRYQVWVNIPAFMMYVYDREEPIEKMKVIVGRKGHNTPVFYNRIRTIVLNPYWRIPASIIRHEMIPKLQKNSNYTNSKKIEIHTGYSEHSPTINPHSINWHKYGKKLPPYKFMQSPGVHNALGKIKYLFPNKYSVYMHDTNQPYLFNKDMRSLSHGCIRLHRPVDLLKTFSTIDSKINFNKAESILEENHKTPLRLSHTIPIDTIYLTVWADEDGIVEFRDDIYKYDKMQLSVPK